MNKKSKVSESAETSAVRREQIVRELRRNGAVEVDALAARHSTSSSTIRRDLAELEHAGLLHRLFYGRFKAKDQMQRGVAYQYFVENTAANPDIVGAHWFQLVDDMPTGRADGERLNYGFLNVLDVPCEPLVRAARESNQRLYQLVFGLTKPSQTLPRMN